MTQSYFSTLNLPSTLKLTISHEQFVQLAWVNQNLQLERTATGELIVMPPTGSETGNKNADILGQIWLWNRQTKLGQIFDSSSGFHLPNGADRSPDVSWISQDRWDTLAPEAKSGFAPLCPDFVLELRSKHDPLELLQQKMQEYQENGAKLGWLIDRRRQKVEIYRPKKTVEVQDAPNSLSGEDILPGFTLDLTEIWN
ncbi:MAG: Uma2 family endonuclease [Cyanobacteriota bacterium]|nr:Uma2 family endonuclease [Cyanobacteriota bacterium]